MSTPTATRLIRQTATNASRARVLLQPSNARRFHSPSFRLGAVRVQTSQPRWISSTRSSRAGLMPDTEEPQPPKEEPSETARPSQPTEISDEEYHERSEEFMNTLNEKAEQLAEGREDVEVEYSAGVLTITFPPNGTYVINKQPPNKQIWLSSPLSGPKRYDWVVVGEGMHQKEGGGVGEWVYLRDGSTLTSLLASELGLVVDPHHEEHPPSTDPTE
ncbi:hypothetical protein M409DRAFT_17810 [Zasmidium cellare ATCC 36951]|uniref:ferroxidase n=1 Tax=Zasmidium cellare ATCC 36951 TaxID=1080233 RepID=A0A6A6D371_ZASCE|nr:uncharacterized protein M409DRAFT_17810 [Zasmidium cellare ATCC 36951]KAF2172579.1 hypothetical protein M409DRAFT_17810 [Zasmidium cellare ATCC 36951]